MARESPDSRGSPPVTNPESEPSPRPVRVARRRERLGYRIVVVEEPLTFSCHGPNEGETHASSATVLLNPRGSTAECGERAQRWAHVGSSEASPRRPRFLPVEGVRDALTPGTKGDCATRASPWTTTNASCLARVIAL